MRFQKMKQEMAAARGGKGSFFAFHGSGPGNWHGILHLGLKNMSGECGPPKGAERELVRTLSGVVCKRSKKTLRRHETNSKSVF